jgi:hypothetical protein
MEHTLFVIYRLKSILLFVIVVIFYLFVFIQRYSSLSHQMVLKSNEKQSHSPKTNIFIQFIYKMINSQIIFFFIIFIFIYSILLAKCYAFAHIIVIILVWKIFFYCNDFIFLLFNNLMRNRHCIWIEKRCPQRWFFPQS